MFVSIYVSKSVCNVINKTIANILYSFISLVYYLILVLYNSINYYIVVNAILNYCFKHFYLSFIILFLLFSVSSLFYSRNATKQIKC